MLKDKIDMIRRMLGEKIASFSKRDVIITEFKGIKNKAFHFTVSTTISIPLNVLDTNVINSFAMRVILNSDIEDRINSLIYILETTENVSEITKSGDKLIVTIEIDSYFPIIENFAESEKGLLDLLEYIEVLNLPTIYTTVEDINIAFSAYRDVINSLMEEKKYSPKYVVC